MNRERTTLVWRFIALGGGCLLLLAACRGVWNQEDLFKGNQRSKPHQFFSHDRHDEALESSDLACEDCHLSVDGEVTEEVSQQGRQSCHGCHVDEKAKEAKSDIKCLSCHIGDMGAILPSDHRAGWVSGHGSRINLRRESCSQCHSNRFCVQCHNRRGKAERVFHRGVALLSHPLEARADPAQCGKCHTASFCIRCHQNKRF